MTKNEALKMAIDYLDGFKSENKETTLELTRIISTLKCALEQSPPKVEPFDVWAGTNPQEPVAWIEPNAQGIGVIRQNPLCEFKFTPTTIKHEPIALYIHPAPAWQELTDDDIKELSRNNKCWINAGGNLMFDWEYFGRAIEQALKEKNHD